MYRDLASEIKRHVPDALVSGTVGRRTSFEITVNGKLIFSKLEARVFPDKKKVVEVVQRAIASGEVEKVKKKDNCVAI
ncbi:hypothetical protein MATL_G00068720 [Megalops atlanticus]|uniref:Selenoprotein W n=1 Tax=Megalops atlanticus TaxID=7932 RepID=A0A9D3Q7F8_MEGAT|nr:hypothetical protein MATL_G00068720 [Megalops atlanticus]